MTEKSGNRGIIAVADYKWKYIMYASVCWGIVLAGFLTFGAKERNWQFWLAEVVMGLFGSGLLYMLLSPKYYFIGRKGPEYEEWLNHQHNNMLQQAGRFAYTEKGFSFRTENEEIQIAWNDIKTISAHLEDEITNDDDIALKIEFGQDQFIEFDEEVEGWTLFIHTMHKVFPGINEAWQRDLLSSKEGNMVLYSAVKN